MSSASVSYDFFSIERGGGSGVKGLAGRPEGNCENKLIHFILMYVCKHPYIYCIIVSSFSHMQLNN